MYAEVQRGAVGPRSRWLLGVLAAVVVSAAWWLSRPGSLSWRLQEAADEMFAKAALDSPEALSAAAAGNLQFNADLVPSFKNESVESVARFAAGDSSPQRRAAAACLLTRWMNLEREARPGAAAALAKLAGADPNPTVRTVAAHSARYWHESPADSEAVVQAVAALPAPQQLKGAEAILKMRKIPDSARPILAAYAADGEPHRRFRAMSALGSSLSKERLFELVDAALSAVDPNAVDEASHDEIVEALKKHAPDRLKNYLPRAPTVRLLVTAASTRLEEPNLTKAVIESATRTLKESDATLYYVGVKSLLMQTGGAAALVQVLREAPPEHAKKIVLEAGDPRQLRGDPRSTTKLSAADLTATAEFVASAPHELAAFAAAAVTAGQGNEDPSTWKWAVADRAKLRQRVGMAPAVGAAWQMAVAATLGANPGEEDLAAFEKFLDSAIAAPVEEKPNETRRGRASGARWFDAYCEKAGPKRAGERLANAFRIGARHPAVVDVLETIGRRPEMLERIEQELLERAAQPDLPKNLANVYGAAAYRLLKKKPQALPPAAWKRLWSTWIDVSENGPGRNRPPSGQPTLADARALVPPEHVGDGVREYLKKNLVVENPHPGVAKVKDLPEFSAEFAKAVRELAADSDVGLRRAALRAVFEFRGDRALASEILLKLAGDSESAIVASAFETFDRLPDVPRPPALAARIRQLSALATPSKLRAIGIYELAGLSDRTDADRKLVEASAADADERVQAAVRFARRNWDEKPAAK